MTSPKFIENKSFFFVTKQRMTIYFLFPFSSSCANYHIPIFFFL